MSRTAAKVTRADIGPCAVEHQFEELFELHDLIERGPDWNAIDKIEIVLSPGRRQAVTVEEAREL